MKATLGGLILVISIAACGGGEPDLAACEDAMRAQLAQAMADPDTEEGTRPTECEGVSDEDAERIAMEILEEMLE
jgi:hypothetical protein